MGAIKNLVIEEEGLQGQLCHEKERVKLAEKELAEFYEKNKAVFKDKCLANADCVIMNEMDNLANAVSRMVAIDRELDRKFEEVESLEAEQVELKQRVGCDLQKAIEDRACELLENGRRNKE